MIHLMTSASHNKVYDLILRYNRIPIHIFNEDFSLIDFDSKLFKKICGSVRMYFVRFFEIY